MFMARHFCLPPSSFFLAAALAFAAMAPAAAQSVAEIAALEGPDRQQRLIEGARKEGSLTLYTSFTTNDMAAFFTAFEKQYGVKVNAWRSSSNYTLVEHWDKHFYANPQAAIDRSKLNVNGSSLAAGHPFACQRNELVDG